MKYLSHSFFFKAKELIIKSIKGVLNFYNSQNINKYFISKLKEHYTNKKT
jgi:hypothetical protein